jgi:hypothetical protein
MECKIIRLAAVSFVLACEPCASTAWAQSASSPVAARSPDLVTPYADIRYRLELVDQKGLPENATASTIRVHAGLKTAVWHGLSALVEGEMILNLGAERFNDTINGLTRFPVVADPEGVLLNQAYVRWKPDSRIELTGGRQAINLDNQRWIGSVGWRQNDQTLDAARLTVVPVTGLAADYIYAWRVNRVFGPDSPQGIWRSNDIHAVRVGYKVKALGTLSGYGYWLDIPAAPAAASRTLGVRLVGEQPLTNKVRLTYAAEYARQTSHGANPLSFGHDYWLIEPGIATGSMTIKAGYERLDGDGRSALQTPLATLHAFNGWADKFLTTPANGLRDIYADFGYKLNKSGPLNGTALRIVYHDYRSTRLGIGYGSEWNASVSYPLRKNVILLAKLARYDANRFATDTTKAWLQVEARF